MGAGCIYAAAPHLLLPPVMQVTVLSMLFASALPLAQLVMHCKQCADYAIRECHFELDNQCCSMQIVKRPVKKRVDCKHFHLQVHTLILVTTVAATGDTVYM